MPARDEAMRLYGTSAPSMPYRMLRAGQLEARLENGNLRYVRYRGVEVLRAISYIIRDRDWGTLAPKMSVLKVEESEGRFQVTYDAVCVNGDAHLTLSAKIEGDNTGALRFDVEATPDRDFETNRCGFTILHGIEGVAGAAVKVEHCDGGVEETVFPELIEPWQPFKSIRALTHNPGAGLQATCRMTGDDFEMEDHRNWSDASYKTYVRPLERPWPYLLSAGECNRQGVELLTETVHHKPQVKVEAAQTDQPLGIELGALSEITFPKIGLVVAPEETRDTLTNIGRLAEVGPQAILCHFDPTAGHGREALVDFAKLQATYPTRYELEYAAVCAQGVNGDLDPGLDAEFENLRDQMRESGFEPDALIVCPSVDRGSTPPGSEWPACPPLEAIYEAARRNFPKTSLGGGMLSYFTELNRKPPPLGLLDFVTHGTNPIVHAADDESVMETLETLPHITRSARAIIGAAKDYRLGPSGIGMRQNPYGSRTFDNPNGERLCMANDDPRQRGLFAAAWTVGYAMRIASAGIERWVPSAFAGPRGILAGNPVALLPVGEAIGDLCRLSGAPLFCCEVSDPKRLAAVLVRDGSQPVCLAANLTDEDVIVEYDGRYRLGPYEVRWLPSSTA